MNTLASTCSAIAQPLDGSPRDFDPIVDLVGDARVVLIGGASHGTHEFHRVRAEITKRLVRDLGFSGVALEADWPDACRMNRYVRGLGDDADATEALGGFERFPHWMWRNADVLDFAGWLRSWNDARAVEQRVGFHGLDLYGMRHSMAAVLGYLRIVDPDAALRARNRYACFDGLGEDPRSYGSAASMGLTPACERAVVEKLAELRRSASAYALRDGPLDPDHEFWAEQDARVVVDAERHYESLFGARSDCWNLRDRHMTDVLASVAAHHARKSGKLARLVVWSHNAHVGDARWTDMARSGQVNVGQLARERYGRDAVSIGFTTFAGTVTAASDWDGPAERKVVRDAVTGSWEQLFHESGLGNFVLDLRRVRAAWIRPTSLLERAIGVIYRPESERTSHYFQADLLRQFDAVLHYDRTRAVEPLERTPATGRGELPETHPSAL